GVIKVVADQASAAAESVKNAAAATGEAAKTAGETASLFAGLPIIIYLMIAVGAIVSTVSFILVRRTRRDDWRRGRR
ncbi:MAG: hypothetical protein JKX72_02370, partial [Robiginitomaculum sp.]|nr:hypothetical protein [Robiginitomaculum sp.]